VFTNVQVFNFLVAKLSRKVWKIFPSGKC